MNKEQTLAAHRIKTKLAMSARNEAKANSRVKVAEAKNVKLIESLDVARDIVNKHKDTLELCKKQIVEQRALISRYEALLNLKYKQEQSKVSEAAAVVKEQAKLKAECDAAKKAIEISKKHYEIAKDQLQAAKKKEAKYEKLLNTKYEEIEALQNKLAEATVTELDKKEDELDEILGACKSYNDCVARLGARGVPDATINKYLPLIIDVHDFEKAADYTNPEVVKAHRELASHFKPKKAKEAKDDKAFEVPAVKAGVTPKKDQAVKPAAADKAKVECDEAKLTSIAKVYAQKYKMPESTSMNVLRKYPLNEAVQKLQSVANAIQKYQSRANESKKPSREKVTETKSVNESNDGTALYSMFL